MEPNEFNSYENTRHNEKLLMQLYEIHKELDEGNQNSENLNDSIKILTNVMVYDQQNTDNRGPRYSNIPDKDTNESTTPKPENNDSKGTSLSESLATQESQKRQQQLDIAKTKLEDRHSMMVDLNITQIELLKKLVEGGRLSRDELSELSKRTAGADDGLSLTDVALGGMVAKFLPKLLPVALLALKGVAAAGVFMISYGVFKKFFKHTGWEDYITDVITKKSEEEIKREKERNIKLAARAELGKTLRSDTAKLSDQIGMSEQEMIDKWNSLNEMDNKDREDFMAKLSQADYSLVKKVQKARFKYLKDLSDVNKLDEAQILEDMDSWFDDKEIAKETEAMREKGYTYSTKYKKWVKTHIRRKGDNALVPMATMMSMDDKKHLTLDSRLIRNAKLQQLMDEKLKDMKEANLKITKMLQNKPSTVKELPPSPDSNKPDVKNEKPPVNERIKSTIPLTTKEGPLPTGIMLQDSGVRDDEFSKNLEELYKTLGANNQSFDTLPMLDVLKSIDFGISKLYDKPRDVPSSGNGNIITAPDQSNQQIKY